MTGKIHSFFAGGTVDGPGIRFVIFLKGCPLRCKYCHNPDTWTQEGALEQSVQEVVDQALKYRGYFATGGGVTVSGGEPLLQMEFLTELFKELKKNKIHTACDTSGITFREDDAECVKKFDELIPYVDLFLLDIKHIDDKEHTLLTGHSNKNVLAFARYLSDRGKKMWIRHVLVPGITLNEEYLKRTKAFIDTLKTVEKIEVLPYHTMGKVKYDNLKLKYPLEGVNPPTKEEIKYAKSLLGVIKNAVNG